MMTDQEKLQVIFEINTLKEKKYAHAVLFGLANEIAKDMSLDDTYDFNIVRIKALKALLKADKALTEEEMYRITHRPLRGIFTQGNDRGH